MSGLHPQSLSFQPRTFKLKVQESTFNDETRVKKSIISSSPMNFAAENKVRRGYGSGKLMFVGMST